MLYQREGSRERGFSINHIWIMSVGNIEYRQGNFMA